MSEVSPPRSRMATAVLALLVVLAGVELSTRTVTCFVRLQYTPMTVPGLVGVPADEVAASARAYDSCIRLETVGDGPTVVSQEPQQKLSVRSRTVKVRLGDELPDIPDDDLKGQLSPDAPPEPLPTTDSS